jgi:EAL domain-containing protein (putative c-di-GMP-specific phosphodiesterase class I)/CheY-like chemotaxis protein
VKQINSILIADDLKTNRLVIKKALEDESYTFIEASNGEEAIALAKEHEPTIIIMDGLMPVMDGFEAVKILRTLEAFQRTPILMISSLSEDAMKLQAIEAGVNDFISKPFEKMELIVRCRSYVEVARTNSQYILSSKNPHTLLPNKVALQRELENQTADILLLRIDNFCSVGTFYGEEYAKNLEKLFGEYLELHFKELGIDISCFHIGSGEFSILFREDISHIDAHEFCKSFHEEIKLYEIELDDFYYDVSATLCFAHAKESLLENASFALETAIKDKKTYVIMHEIIDDLKQDATNNIASIHKVKKALEEDRIVPFFQPIFDTKVHDITKYEALVRLIEEDGKVLSPFFFLEAAKKGNYYLQITEVMLEKVFALFKYVEKEVTINLSFLDISSPLIYEKIMQLLKNNPDTASRVTFELLEDEAVEDNDILLNFIEAVRHYGVKIAIDDFGSGYSNFQRIMDINPDIVKIDGSIIKDINQSQKSQVLTEAINTFSHSLGIQTVAEFVADEETFMQIKTLGIDYAQGYYIAQPAEKLVTIQNHPSLMLEKETVDA